MTILFQRGYEAAMREIKAGKNPTEIYNVADTPFDYNDFDRGWQDAAIQAGANIL